MSDFDHSEVPPAGAAQGDLARAALRRWQIAEHVGPQRFKPGTGVWAVRRGKDNVPALVAAHVGCWNALTGLYHVIPDDEPLRPFFVHPSRIVPRFVGEVAPGVERYCP
jgi:hypothetical protein